MKGIDNLLLPLTDRIGAPSELIAHPLFDYTSVLKLVSLQATILQQSPELQSIMGEVNITDAEGLDIMVHLSENNTSTGSDGSVKCGK